MVRLARLLGLLVPLFAVVTLPVGILLALFVGLFEAAVVFVVGWLFLVPVTAILAGVLSGGHPAEHLAREDEETVDSADEADEDPVEVLRDRYARGEIDDAELERRLDALLELDHLDPDDGAAIERVRDRLDAELERE